MTEAEKHARDIIALSCGLEPAFLKPVMENRYPFFGAGPGLMMSHGTAGSGYFFDPRHLDSLDRLIFNHSPRRGREVESFQIAFTKCFSEHLELLGGRLVAVENYQIFFL